jgi:hypothetical protein
MPTSSPSRLGRLIPWFAKRLEGHLVGMCAQEPILGAARGRVGQVGHDVKVEDVGAVASGGARAPATASENRRVREPGWHTLGTTGVRLSNTIRSPYQADLHKHWWARTVSNRRPLVCKTRALPLSYAPVRRKDTARPRGAQNGDRPFSRCRRPARRSKVADRGLHRAASSRRTGSPQIGRRRKCRGLRNRRHR